MTQHPECYVALFTADPVKVETYTDTYEMDITVEVSGQGYQRQPVKFEFTQTGDGFMARNLDSILFPEALTDWGVVTHMSVLFEEDRGFCTPLTQGLEIIAGDTIEIRPGELALLIPQHTCKHCQQKASQANQE
ncbi:hypothetical protein GJ688_02720 [Heliobacillus mobilis]|uniref:Uncharacterized protein n=1 Tax=Heliobacterium mobile TaxID=28064 RepID=A0A6I3SDN8_HELMO|nr:hypothetical protein [Heliobacterium mobile]MTV47895.1 hypothetical protein [Heliobacterium mobile]